jgi:hypothetical protein
MCASSGTSRVATPTSVFGLFRRLQVSNYSNLCEGSRCVDSSVLCAEYTSEESDNVEQ